MEFEKTKRFIPTYQDEMGMQGYNVDDVSITDENGFIGYASDIELLMKSSLIRILDKDKLISILDQCKSAV